MKGCTMFQEINIGGDRQTGKSYAAMKLAIAAAGLGERVIFDCDNGHMAAERFRQLQTLSPASEIAKVIRSNGNERINFRTGGSIIMEIRARGGGRGVTADLHVLDHEREGGEVNPTVQRVIRTVLTPGDLAVVGVE